MAAAGYGVGKNCYPEKVNITAHIEYLMAKDPVLRERFGIQKEVPKYEPVIEVLCRHCFVLFEGGVGLIGGFVWIWFCRRKRRSLNLFGILKLTQGCT